MTFKHLSKKGYSSQAATNAQHRANNFGRVLFSSIPNKSYTGQHTAKQDANLAAYIERP